MWTEFKPDLTTSPRTNLVDFMEKCVSPAASVSIPKLWGIKLLSHLVDWNLCLFFNLRWLRCSCTTSSAVCVLAHIWRQNKQHCKSHTHFAEPLIIPPPPLHPDSFQNRCVSLTVSCSNSICSPRFITKETHNSGNKFPSWWRYYAWFHAVTDGKLRLICSLQSRGRINKSDLSSCKSDLFPNNKKS